MAKKVTPNLPASSRMQMPTTGGGATTRLTKESGSMKGKTGAATKKMMTSAKGKGMASKKGY